MPTSLIPLFPGMPGGPEMIVILLIVVLLFGANKLPKLARSSGQAMGEFKKGREEVEEELKNMRGETIGDESSSATEPTTSNEPDASSGQSSTGQSSESGATEWGSPATDAERERNRR